MFSDHYYILICSLVMPLAVLSANGGHPPQIRKHPSAEIAYKDLEPVQLTCEAQGSPNPHFYWEKDGERLELNDNIRLRNGTLTINNPTPALHDGIYQCFAYNDFGVAITTKALVKKAVLVSFPSVPVPPIHRPDVGDSLTLVCNPPQSFPSGMVYWGENSPGNNLHENKLHPIDYSERVSIDYTGNLYFSYIEPEDFRHNRTYVCIAVEHKVIRGHVVGSDQRINPKQGSLTNRAPAILWSSSSTEVAIKGQQKKMKCIFSGYPTPTVTWTRLKNPLPDRAQTNSSFGQEIIIDRVSHEDAGRYRCAAKNSDNDVKKDIELVVESPPDWRQERAPQDVVASEDDDVEFECVADGVPNPTISWSFNGRPYNDSRDSRLTVSGNKVRFRSVLKNDSQVLQCNASNVHGYILANAFLLVRAEAPSILRAPENLKVAKGRDVVFPCRMDGAPKPTIEWTRGETNTSVTGERFQIQTNGDLKILNTVVDDTDTYHCTGSNKLGVETVDGQLIVRNKTLIIEPPQSQVVNRSSRVKFVCKAKTDRHEMSSLTITWYKDGQLLDLSSHTNTSFILINNSLIIDMAQVSDSGEYKCLADNKVDSDQVSVLLTVKDRPQAPTNIAVNSCGASKAEISWSASVDNNDLILEYIVFYNTSYDVPDSFHVGNRTNRTTAAVSSLQPFTNYTFHVTAKNSIGTSDRSAFTQALCRTPEAKPFRSPTHVCTCNGKPEDLVIMWKPMQRYEHNGENFHYKVKYSPASDQTEDGFSEEELTENVSDWRQKELVIANKGTYRRYKISVLAANNIGTVPEQLATTIFGHSSEGVPSVVPENLKIEKDTLNSTSVLFTWDPVNTSADSIKGFFKGFQVQFWKSGNPDVIRTEDLILHNPPPDCAVHKKSSKHNRFRRSVDPFNLATHKLWGGATIKAAAVVVNGANAGKLSDVIEFITPEGVPEAVSSLSVTERGTHHIKLKWKPPSEINGILDSFIISYRALNGSTPNTFKTVIDNAQQTTAKVHNLQPETAYDISIIAYTATGGGPETHVKTSTLPVSGPLDMPCIDTVAPGDDFVVVTWRPSCENPAKNPGSKFVVEYQTKDTTEQNTSSVEMHYDWVNLTGLTTGKTYEVIVVAMNQGGETKRSESRTFVLGPQQEPILHTTGISGWLIALIIAILLFLLIIFLICFIKHRRQGKYPVHEKEKLHGCNPDNIDEEPKFGEYTKGNAPTMRPTSHGSLDSIEKPAGSDSNSLAEYEDTDPTKFNEDGSFIGQYGGQKKVATAADQNAPFATIV